jgi:hypothetical protein
VSDRDPATPGAPEGRRPDPGTARAHEVWRRSRPLMLLPTMLFGLIAGVGGPILLYQLIARGLREGRASWFALGVICAIPWCLVVYVALKRLVSRR